MIKFEAKIVCLYWNERGVYLIKRVFVSTERFSLSLQVLLKSLFKIFTATITRDIFAKCTCN